MSKDRQAVIAGAARTAIGKFQGSLGQVPAPRLGAAVIREAVSRAGITPDMVQRAPYFEHVADEVERRLEGRVFVAHNATFDWSFVSAELVRSGGDAPRMPKLCTVRMCRRLVPQLRHRNLDVVSRHFGIEIQGRHRAYGDAFATAQTPECIKAVVRHAAVS